MSPDLPASLVFRGPPDLQAVQQARCVPLSRLCGIQVSLLLLSPKSRCRIRRCARALLARALAQEGAVGLPCEPYSQLTSYPFTPESSGGDLLHSHGAFPRHAHSSPRAQRSPLPASFPPAKAPDLLWPLRQHVVLMLGGFFFEEQRSQHNPVSAQGLPHGGHQCRAPGLMDAAALPYIWRPAPPWGPPQGVLQVTHRGRGSQEGGLFGEV